MRIKEWITASKKRTVIVVVLVVISLIVGGFLGWALTPLGPMDEALDALESDDEVEVKVSSDRVTFTPADREVKTGLVIYPGGRVDHQSYAPVARQISEEGFLVVITKMPLNLAFFDQDEAEEVINDHPEVESWAVGGHSLGGVMAARFADEEKVIGLVLWASYPDEDLSDKDISVLSLYGTRDGVTTVEDVKSREDKLPPDAELVAIEGGNHAQFGWYGDQRGDNEATITRVKQQRIIVDKTAGFLVGL
ncbi:MAG: alpha/beta hydrolase [Candidatus Natronoplasma sp.]